jgi:hypothetical protein
MAMSTMGDSDLSTVTGQSGVSINLDVSMDLHMDTAAWGDSDGLGAGSHTGSGWIGLQGVDATGIRVRLRQDFQTTIDAIKAPQIGLGPTGVNGTDLFFAAGGWMAKPDIYTIIATNNGGHQPTLTDLFLPAVQHALGVAYAGGNANAGGTLATLTALGTWKATDLAGFGAAMTAALTIEGYVQSNIFALTIDVATGTPIGGLAGTTYVQIGLGSLEIGIGTLNANVALGSTNALGQTMGSLYMQNVMVYVNGAYSVVDIYKHTTVGTNNNGVGIGFAVKLDKISFDYLSWGDADGVASIDSGTNTLTGGPNGYQGTNSTTAGYVGLTTDATTPSTTGMGTAEIQDLRINGALTIDVATSGHTFVEIGYNDLSITMGQLDANVALGMSKNSLGNFNNVLGTLYMKNLSVTLANGHVDISAPTTGAGVRIDFDVTAGITADTLAWGDQDGFGYNYPRTAFNNNPFTHTAVTGGGWVGLDTLVITGLHVGGQAAIDVATAQAGNTMGYTTGTTFVRLGFGGGLTVGMASMTANVEMGPTRALGQVLGNVELDTMAMTVNGYVDIMTHAATQGVVINLSATIPTLTIASITWGDADGIGTGSTAGYVGLKNLAITNLVIAGPVAIDVATIKPSATDNYALYRTVGMSDTFVHLALGNGTADIPLPGNSIIDPVAGTFSAGTLGIKMASMAVDVVLGNGPNLQTGTTSTLGSLYIKNLVLGVNGWVDIAAH